MITLEVRDEFLPGWEAAAVRNQAASVEEFAQAHIDNLGRSYEQQRQLDDARAQQDKFDLALRLTEARRSEWQAKLRELALAQGLITPEQADEMFGAE